MNERRPILVTGHRGYLGSVMAPYLFDHGYDVIGLDTGYFDDCTLVPDPVRIPAIDKDIRDLAPTDLRDLYAVIHLAALSNDPIGNLDVGWTEAINHDATVRLAELACAAGVRRFLFSSSCIMYGMNEAGVVDETSPLDPQTTYARSKVRSEEALREFATDEFSPTYVRNGTVYGISPRMRFDTVLNDLVAQALTTGRIEIHGDGAPWRPVIHVGDVARSFQAYLEAPREVVHDRAFNNGADHLNHQVRELAEFAAAAVPGAEVAVLDRASADRRTYRASFARFAETFPDFTWQPAADGAAQLARELEAAGVRAEDYTGDRYIRLRWLRRLMDERKLDDDLRWTEEAA
ncbi:MAG: SDR family oxidoreductase [Actinobacteria bacterium]|nr:SDR family oxidoreductase [Actinomycetota bacterium]